MKNGNREGRFGKAKSYKTRNNAARKQYYKIYGRSHSNSNRKMQKKRIHHNANAGPGIDAKYEWFIFFGQKTQC